MFGPIGSSSKQVAPCHLLEMARDVDDLDERLSTRAAENMRRARKAKGWTFAEMSARTGLSRSYLSGIESGSDRMSFRVLVLVAQALSMSTDDLLGIAADVSPSTWHTEATEGGLVDLKGFSGRGTVRVATDLPDIGLAKGDYLVIESEAELRPGRYLVVEDEDGEQRLWRVVESGDRVIIERHGRSPAVLTPRYHQVLAVAVRSFREL